MIGKFQNTVKYRKHQTGILLFPLWGHLEFDDRNMPKKKVGATYQLHDMLLWRYRKSPLERQKFSEVKMALIFCILFHQYTEHHVYILIGNNFRIMFLNIKLLTEYLIIYNV